MSGPPAQPLEFPAPTVHRGVRVTVNGCDHRTGKFHRVKNVLIRAPDRGGAGGGGRIRPRGGAGGAALPERGYCIRRKICDTIYGSVRLCVVMRRREPFHGEGRPQNWQRLPRQDSPVKRGGNGGLESIGEEDDDWAEASLEVPPGQHGGEEDDVVWESTDELVVVKVVSWSKVQSKRGKHLEDPIKEVAAMQLIGGYHPHVVGSIEVLQDHGHLYSITPYCDGGDLYSWTMTEFESNGTGRLDEPQARHWFRHILKGLSHLQKKGVCHRDISLENILVHKNRCAIIDFGMALRVPYSDPCNDGCVADVSAGTPVRRLMRAQGQGGRWTYMAPEVVSRDPSFDGFAIDLWGAAVALYIMLVGLAPFRWAHESDPRFQKFSTGGLRETLRYWKIPVSDEACDLLQGMFWRDPRQRFTLAEVMEHPWVVGEDGAGARGGEAREESARSNEPQRNAVVSTSKEQAPEFRSVVDKKQPKKPASKRHAAGHSPEKDRDSPPTVVKFTGTSKLQHLLRGKLTKGEARQACF